MANYDIGDALSRIENILLDSIGRNMKRHLREEADLQKAWSMWQTEQLTSLGNWSAKNYQQFAPQFTKINNSAMNLLRQANQNGELNQEIKILQTGIQNAQRFFDVPDDKLDSLLKSVRSDLSRAEHAILRKADDVYREALFDSHFYLESGSGTLNAAIDMAVEDLHQRGLNSVTYRNGAHVPASSYARMALRSANERAQLLGEGKARDKFGIHTVIVPPSGIACPKCAPWLCRVLVDDVYSAGTPAEAANLNLPLLSEAIRQGFLHPQCNCSPQTYFPDSPVPEMSEHQREEAVRKYQITQRQRYNERQIRKWKQVKKSAPDEAAKKSASARKREWQKRNKDLVDQHSDFLRRDYFREKIYDNQTPPITPNVIDKPTPPEPTPKITEAKPAVLTENTAVTKNIVSEPDYMSNSFRPIYTEEKTVQLNNNIIIEMKRVGNSEISMITDIDATRRNKAVRLSEKLLKTVRLELPENFELPEVAVIDFNAHQFNPNAIGGFHAPTGILFLNSLYDTEEKILGFVTKNQGEFANQTIFAPLLHELGHKFYEDCVKTLAKSKKIEYNKAKGIIDHKIFDFIRENDLEYSIGQTISSYAQKNYNKSNYTEVIAESFSVKDSNELARALINLLRGDFS